MRHPTKALDSLGRSRCTDRDRRWGAADRLALVLAIQSGNCSVREASISFGLEPAEIDAWRLAALRGARRELERLCNAPPPADPASELSWAELL